MIPFIRTSLPRNNAARRAPVAFVLAAAVGCIGCGTSTRSTETLTAKTSGVSRTARLADTAKTAHASSKRACADARKAIRRQRANWPVICPQLLPPGPARIGFGGYGPYGDVTPGYVFDGESPDIGLGSNGGHWTLAVATKTQLAAAVSRAGRSVGQKTMIAGRPVTIYRIRGYDQGGGYYAGHVVVEWVGRTSGCQTSVHGYAHRQLAIRMMRAIIRHCARGLG